VKRILLHGVLPLLVLAMAAAGAMTMIKTAAETEPESVEAVAPVVEVSEVAPFDGAAQLTGTGIVEPQREATIFPEVAGRITFLHGSLVEGGRVRQGDVLVRIDSRTYKAAISQQRAQVKRAELDLELQQGEAAAARAEWDAARTEPPEGARRIALRKPQVESAEANFDAARSALHSARLDADKTVLRAPFNATVTSEQVETGEVVAPGTLIATLVGADGFVARVSVPVEYLALVQLPGPEQEGSPVLVEQRLTAGTTVQRRGEVLRLLSQLDAKSRTAQLLVSIERPLDPEPGELPLLVGAFVNVVITGRTIPGALSVPRQALFAGNRVWVVDEAQQLRSRDLTIAFSDDDRVIVTGGVKAGDRVVVSKLGRATEGMQVRLEEGEADA
jgi:RND family efflux transporter MFP subunit